MMPDHLQIFDQYVEKHDRAFQSFNRVYESEHAKPTHPRWYAGLPWMMFPFGVIAFAGIALSALRTAPVFQQIAAPIVGVELATAEAALAVLVIEVFVVAVRYAMVVQGASDGHTSNIQWWMRLGFWVAFVVAIAANLYASAAHLDFIQPFKPVLDFVVALVVGFSAPLLAVISGDILGILYTKSEQYRADLRATFDKAMGEWVSARDAYWQRRKADYGLSIRVGSEFVQPSAPNQLPAVSNGISIGMSGMELEAALPARSTLGHSKAPNASAKAREYFQANPAVLMDDSADLISIATELGVGKSTMYAVRGKMRSEQGSQS